jgi:hypothetical protein
MTFPRRAAAVVCLLASTTTAPLAQEGEPSLRVRDRGRDLVIEYGPLKLPAGAHHTEAVEPPALIFTMPVDGWMRGYEVLLTDAAGRALAPELLHHMNVIAKNRRDLFSHVMLRVGSAGRETKPVTLPRLLGVRLQRGDTLIMTLMLHNPTLTSYEGVHLRVRVPYTAARSRIGAVSVYPFSVAIGPKEKPNVFDLPPGRSEHYWEGSPATPVRVIAVSGHLHRYGVALRLEDRTTRETLWEARPTVDPTGEVLAMPVKLFVWSMGKPMRPDHLYRLTAVYDNPEPRTIHGGGMGVLGGIVVLSRHARWPGVDARHPEYLQDVASILKTRAEGDGPSAASDAAKTAKAHAH